MHHFFLDERFFGVADAARAGCAAAAGADAEWWERGAVGMVSARNAAEADAGGCLGACPPMDARLPPCADCVARLGGVRRCCHGWPTYLGYKWW